MTPFSYVNNAAKITELIINVKPLIDKQQGDATLKMVYRLWP